jgi:three-Cys-motif partner protein
VTAPRTTIWQLDAHTRAKHEILRSYLGAWIPILSFGKFPILVYIDGFAGPGQYSKGEDGSPILAVKAVMGQKVPITAALRFSFVEKDARRAAHLRSLLDELKLPSNLSCAVLEMTFEAAYAGTLKPQLDGPAAGAPVFAFLDPFGFTGIPFDVVSDILRRPRAEVLVTFMYEEINRFATLEDQAGHMDRLFGTSDWGRIRACETVPERRRFFEALYAGQLNKCARFVRSFQMRNKNDATDYFLFYATNHPLGLAKMKEAMWRVDPTGEFAFSDATDPAQAIMFSEEPDYVLLSNVIHRRFLGKTHCVREIENFVIEQTAFTASHFKKALKALESAAPPRVEAVDPPPERKKNTYADPGLRLRFL